MKPIDKMSPFEMTCELRLLRSSIQEFREMWLLEHPDTVFCTICGLPCETERPRYFSACCEAPVTKKPNLDYCEGDDYDTYLEE